MDEHPSMHDPFTLGGYSPLAQPRSYKRNLDPWKNYEADDVWMAPREMQRAAYRAATEFLKVRSSIAWASHMRCHHSDCCD
jgi:hypothetical protein